MAIIALRIEDIGNNTKSQFKKKIMILSGFPGLLMNQQMFIDTAQLLIQRGNAEFQVTKELISLHGKSL